MWNQKKPPWFEAIIDLINPILSPITATVINAVKTGASIYQAMSIVLACFSQLWDCITSSVPLIARIIQDLLPVDITPIGNSTLLQLVLSALYSNLQKKSELIQKKQVKFDKTPIHDETTCVKPTKGFLTHKNSVCSFDGTVSTDDTIALAVAEALCSIDEDDKHTEQISEFINQAKESLETDMVEHDGHKRVETIQQMTEILVGDILMNKYGKKSLKVLHYFIQCNSEWISQKLTENAVVRLPGANRAHPVPNHLLHTMFHIGSRSFDQVSV